MRSATGCKALCLCAVALGPMAFNASAAQASTWMTGGTNLTSGIKSLGAWIVGSSAKLLTRIAGIHVAFTCTGVTLVNMNLASEGRIQKEGKFFKGTYARFTGCNTTLKTKKEEEKAENGNVSTPCEPADFGSAGVIETDELKGSLKEHFSGEGVVVLEPTGGEKIAKIEMSEECSIGEAVPIVGKLGIVDSGGMSGLLTEAKTHKVKEGPLTELWAISKTEEHRATVQGELQLELGSGEIWNGLLP